MLRCLKSLEGYKILATDGEIGKVDDFYFDDSIWAVRYVVVKTGTWLMGRRVLLPPAVLGRPARHSGDLPADLTIREIREGRGAEADEPVSCQEEERLTTRYGWPSYGAAAGTLNDENITMGLEMVARARMAEESNEAIPRVEPQVHGDPHLRSMREVTRYVVESAEGQAGHVGDFIVDDRTWRLRHVVVEMRRMLPRKRVLVPVEWIDEVSWSESKVHARCTQKAIREGPEFDPAAPVNRELETRLYDYYGRPREKPGKRHPLVS